MTVQAGVKDRGQFDQQLGATFGEMNHNYWGSNPKDWAAAMTPAEADALWQRYQATGAKGISWQGLRNELSVMRGGRLDNVSDPGIRSYNKSSAASAKKNQTTEQAAAQAAAQPTTTAAPAAPGGGNLQPQPGDQGPITGAGGGLSPDTLSAINAIPDPKLRAAALAAAQNNANSGGPVNLFGSGVDQNAQVLSDRRTQASPPPPTPTDRFSMAQASVPTYAPSTAGAEMQNLYQMTPDDVKRLQLNLWQNGWYQAEGVTNLSEISLGRVDEKTITAYSDVLSVNARQYAANKNNYASVPTVSGTMLQGSPNKPKSTKTGTGLGKVDPAMSLYADYQTEAQNLTGANLPATEGMQYASYAQQAERQANQQQAAGQEYMGAMSPTAYIMAHNPGEIAHNDAVNRGLEFFRLLGLSV